MNMNKLEGFLALNAEGSFDTGPGWHDYLFSGTLNRPGGLSLRPYLDLIAFSYLLVALMMRGGNVLWWNSHKLWPTVQ